MHTQRKTFKIHTLGCRTNQYESQGYASQLLALGYEPALEEEADIHIVNSCTVTHMADVSSRQLVKRLYRKQPEAKIIVTGCAAEQDSKAFQEMPGVLRVVSNAQKDQLLPLTFPEESWPEFSLTQFEAHTRAFVKVQDGCNSFCTYCIIPYVRGRSRSRSLEEILREVHVLVSKGFKEVVLTGINIGDFDGNMTPPMRLAALVKAVDGVEGLERLRVSSIDPDEVDEELIEVLLHGRTTCPSLHIVLQSGSNAILKRMNRKYTAQIFLDTIERLEEMCSDFTYTTDVIVGFPGETEVDFSATIAMMERVQFAKVHMFPYSKRARTRAALYSGHLSDAIMQERKTRVLHVAEKTSKDLRDRYVGRTMPVLLEGKEECGSFFGHTENFLPVWVRGDCLVANTIVNVFMQANSSSGLQGVCR